MSALSIENRNIWEQLPGKFNTLSLYMHYKVTPPISWYIVLHVNHVGTIGSVKNMVIGWSLVYHVPQGNERCMGTWSGTHLPGCIWSGANGLGYSTFGAVLAQYDTTSQPAEQLPSTTGKPDSTWRESTTCCHNRQTTPGYSQTTRQGCSIQGINCLPVFSKKILFKTYILWPYGVHIFQNTTTYYWFNYMNNSKSWLLCYTFSPSLYLSSVSGYLIDMSNSSTWLLCITITRVLYVQPMHVLPYCVIAGILLQAT